MWSTFRTFCFTVIIPYCHKVIQAGEHVSLAHRHLGDRGHDSCHWVTPDWRSQPRAWHRYVIISEWRSQLYPRNHSRGTIKGPQENRTRGENLLWAEVYCRAGRRRWPRKIICRFVIVSAAVFPFMILHGFDNGTVLIKAEHKLNKMTSWHQRHW